MKMGNTIFGTVAFLSYFLGIILIVAGIFSNGMSAAIPIGISLFSSAVVFHAIHEIAWKNLTFHQQNLEAQETVIKLLKVIALKNVTDANDRETLLALGNPDKQLQMKKAAAEKAKRDKQLAEQKSRAVKTFDQK